MRIKTRILRLSLLMGFAFPLLISCSSEKVTGGNEGVDTIAIKTPVVLRQIPHDPTAFTQGLLLYNGFLYESTGLQCCASIRVINPQNGQIVKFVDVPGSQYFTEGIAIRNNKLVQLTYLRGVAFIYSLPDLVKEGEFNYVGQGWGLTSDSTGFIMSNGSDTLYFRDDSFKVVSKVNVTSGGASLLELNELEYANGKVYANVWHNDSIYVVSPRSGKVMSKIDCTNLMKIAQPIHPQEDVLNGIAYDASSGKFYLTGKRWKYIFEVTIPGE